jgi:hypothetical protein
MTNKTLIPNPTTGFHGFEPLNLRYILYLSFHHARESDPRPYRLHDSIIMYINSPTVNAMLGIDNQMTQAIES